jgi:hypothetical protein
MSLAEAQRRVPFTILVPANSALPSFVIIPPSVRVSTVHLPSYVPSDPPTDYVSVEISYAYQKNTGPPKPRRSDPVALIEYQVSTTESEPIGPGDLTPLDGRVVRVNQLPGDGGADITWVQDRASYELSTVLSWADTLRIYRSLAPPNSSTDAILPSKNDNAGLDRIGPAPTTTAAP